MKGLAFSILMLLLIPSPAGTGAEVQPPPAADSSGGERDDLEEFVPSERVPADTAVSFPWDI